MKSRLMRALQRVGASAPTIKPRKFRAAIAAAFALALLSAHPAARAQGVNNMMPAESAAKARAVLDQAIEALGGPVYLRLHDSDCTAKFAGFERSGEIGGIGEVRVMRQLPDKNRTEYDKLGTIVTVYAGDKGWTLDRSGVEELPASEIAAYQEQLKNDANYILRYRRDEPGLVLRYGGSEVVDLKQVDWVEVGDKEGRNVRIAVDRSSHFPVRFVVATRDSEGVRGETITVYSNYRPVSGIQMAFQVSRFRNGVQISQVFYNACKYNTGLADDLFSRVSLDKHFASSGKKK
jgi:outer membrane lipoprotein-sorting protein